MKIGFKIALIAIVGLLAVFVSVYVGQTSTRNVENLFNYTTKVPMKNADSADALYLYMARVTTNNALAILNKNNPEKFNKNIESIKLFGDKVSNLLQFLKSNETTEEGIKMLDSAEAKLKISSAARDKLSKLMAEQKWDEALEFRTGQYNTDVLATLAAIRLYCDYSSDLVSHYAFEESDKIAEKSEFTLYLTTGIAVVILSVLSIVIIIGITRPLKKAVEAANRISDGDMNVDLQTNAKDETGTLMKALDGMVGSINRLISDSNVLANAAVAGQLSTRADANKHRGAYKELITGVNNTLDAVIAPLNVAAKYVERISNGDIPPKITDTYNGDFNELKNNLNYCIDAINLLMVEVNHSINEALEGHLTYRADTSKHHGDYKKLMDGTNKLVDAFVEPIQVVSNFLQDVAVGSRDIKPITVEYKGDFNTVKNSMNATYDILMFFLTAMERASSEAQHGNLEHEFDFDKAPGAWKILLQGVQKIIDAARSIINESGDALAIMATGDLTPRITTNYSGKFGEMRDNINNLGDSLTDLISQLQEAIHTTASASAEISATADTLAAASQEQSSQTDEVATAMEEMSRTVIDNAHSAVRTADVARQSGEVANNGGKVVHQTVAKMREIATVVRTSADNIIKLGESSKKIGEIISVIDDIADQTNLLSLNAAIEAARAGEQGRGFAVVADSVGKLAVSTVGATKEIAEMIKGIQLDTEAAVQAMEKGTSEVQSGIELADNAGTSLQDILTGINELLDMVSQIAAASEEQSATSEEISKNISAISKVTADSARNIEDVASTANELARMTDTLTSLVSQFKVNAVYGASNSNNQMYLH